MKINTFFLRIAACCNLNCDYCYVFKHRDTSWQNYPKVISLDTVKKFSYRLREYAVKNNIEELNIVFHGGEPLMCGTEQVIHYADIIKSQIGSASKVYFSIQTNGTLITEQFVHECDTRNIGISLSIDGPNEYHNKHRKFKNNDDSFICVMNAVHILNKHPNVFEGVIGVIDPLFNVKNVFDFFDNTCFPSVDLLLPDSTYLDLPLGREKNKNIYIDWLIAAFDAWFFEHPNIQMRTFEHIVGAIIGESSSLDAFGLGCLDYLTIETDGSYHTSDIMKVAYQNASSLNMDIEKNSIEEALTSPKVSEYNLLLSEEQLPYKCKQCEYNKICGGGSLPHRYSPTNGFDNPTIYCEEMFSLIRHAQQIVEHAIDGDNDV